jgi:hypothetical protein
MGFLGKLFGECSSKERWRVITTKIARDLEIFRDQFFQRCVEYVEALSTRDSFKGLELSVVHRTLGEEADVFIKTYQLILASTALQQYQYIPESEMTDFLNLLYAQVCGTKVGAMLEQSKIYSDFKKNFETPGNPLEARVGIDVVKYISGGNKAVVLINPLFTEEVLLWLNFSVQSAVAGEFGDMKTSENIQLAAKRFSEKIRERKRASRK